MADDLSTPPQPGCDEPAQFWLAKHECFDAVSDVKAKFIKIKERISNQDFIDAFFVHSWSMSENKIEQFVTATKKGYDYEQKYEQSGLTLGELVHFA